MKFLPWMVAIVALFGVVGCGREGTATVRGRVTLPEHGRVTVSARGPAAGDRVVDLEGDPRVSDWFGVGPDGSFGFSRMRSGRLDVVVAINGVEQKTIVVPPVDVERGSDATPPQLNPIRVKEVARSYRVRVVDSAGAPVRGALVVNDPSGGGGSPEETSVDGTAIVVSVDPRPTIGAFKAQKRGEKGSRPKVVTAEGEDVEIVLEDRIPFRVRMANGVRLPSQLRFYCLIAPRDPNAKPDPKLKPNTELAECPPELRWTVFMSNGEFVGEEGEATIELPCPGSYAVIPYIADAKDAESRMRFLPKWLPIVVKDEPGQRFTVEVTQERIDSAVREFLATDSKPSPK